MTTLNKIKIKYQDGKNIINAFVNNNVENMNILSEFLTKNAILYQYLFANLFPKCFSRVDDYGIMAKTSFNKFYHSYHVQKNMLKLIKEEQNEVNDKANQKIDSPINMTTLFDDEIDENKENIDPKSQKQKQNKRKIENDELKKQKAHAKKQKRETKKQILLEKLNENTDKMLQIRGKK